jgi:hypothetical protein
MDSDQQRHLEELRQAYQKRFRILQLQAAQQGLHTPPHVLFELDELRDQIAEIDAQLNAATSSAFGNHATPRSHDLPPASQKPSGLIEISPGVVMLPWNMSFDLPVRAGRPPGWCNSNGFVSNVSLNYTCQIEPRRDGEPGSCARFANPHAQEGEFGSLMQRCLAGSIAASEVMLEGQLRSKQIEQWAGLWLRADGVENPLFFENMSNRPIRGSTPWTTYTIIARLPTETTWLNYGIVLQGRGTLWADNLRVMVRDARGAWIPVGAESEASESH